MRSRPESDARVSVRARVGQAATIRVAVAVAVATGKRLIGDGEVDVYVQSAIKATHLQSAQLV